MSYMEDVDYALRTKAEKEQEARIVDPAGNRAKSSGLTTWNIVWGVFGGLWLFAITAAVVYGLTKL